MSDKKIHIIVSTHQGRLYDEKCDYIVIKCQDGEFAIFPDHIPVVTSVKDGFVKMVRDKDQFYVCLANSVIEFHDNTVTVLAQEAHIGRDMDSARVHFNMVRKERLEKNRKLDADLTVSEKEILDNIKESKAGNL